MSGPSFYQDPFRIEAWDEDGTWHVLALTPSYDGIHAYLLTFREEGLRFRFGHVVIYSPGTGLDDEPDDPMLLPRHAIMRLVEQRDAHEMHCRVFGLPDMGHSPLAMRIAQDVATAPWEDICPIVFDDLVGPVYRTFFHSFDPRFLGYDTRRANGRIILPHPDQPPVPCPQGPADPTAALVPPAGREWTMPEAAEAANRHLREATDPIRRALGTDIPAILGRHWSPQAHLFYAAPGEVGERRRQAGRLQPAFSPVIAGDPRISGLVDGGLPFEDSLAQVLASWVNREHRPDITDAHMRRFRAIPNDLDFHEVLDGFLHATRLPLDYIPRSSSEWRLFALHYPLISMVSHRMSLDPTRVIRPLKARWRDEDLEARVYGTRAPTYLTNGFGLAHDVFKRCQETLTHPIREAIKAELGLPQDYHLTAVDAEVGKITGAILWGDKGIAAIVRASDRWHDRVHAFEDSLPLDAKRTSWPALTEPFTAPNGLLIVPLTTPRELKQEGQRGPDRDGIEGLDHCVGGYVDSCAKGVSHIISVRRVEAGVTERISTVEAHLVNGGDGPRIGIGQHFGRANDVPPKEAEDAVSAWLAAVARGDCPLNPDALEWRGMDYEDGPYDWRIPGNLERAFAAWAPHLSQDAARAGFEFLRQRIRAAVAPHIQAYLAEMPRIQAEQALLDAAHAEMQDDFEDAWLIIDASA